MQTIGERLEEARKRKGISIREAAEATKIRGDYLQKFESNQFDFNLAELYVRGFLRSYAQFLKLPADKIVNDFNGLGISNRPRTPSREIYGRMDLSVAKADGSPSAKESAPDDAEPAPTQRRQPAPFARTGSSLTSAPAIDPNLVFKGGLILIGVIVAALVIWLVKSLFSGSPTTTTAANPPPPAQQQPPPPATREYILVALDNVTVTVWHKISGPPAKYGEEVFSVPLERGRTRRLSIPGPYYVGVSDPKALAVEVGGQRLDTKGASYYELP